MRSLFTHINTGFVAICLSLVFMAMPLRTQADSLSLEQVLQKVIDHYPTLKAAAIEVEKARLNSIQVQSQLGWQLNSRAGISNDVSFFGTGVKKIDAGAGIERQLMSGGNLSFDAGLRREDADDTLPNLANPNTISNLRLNYRRPLQQGAGNPSYTLSLELAKNSVSSANADKLSRFDRLAEQVINLYLAAAATQAQVENIHQSLQHTERLRKFIEGRYRLGIAEDKDQLQVVAQYHSQQAQLKVLNLASVQQTVSLNQLMGEDWETTLVFNADDPVSMSDVPLPMLESQVKKYSPALQQIESRLALTEIQIKSRQDTSKDKLDLVSYLGLQNSEGSSELSGDQNDSELIGGIRLEYRQNVDHSGDDALLRQAQLERDIVLQQKQQVFEDLHYAVATTLAEMKAVQESIDAYKLSVNSEQEKLKDADQRYRKSRIDVDRLIQFETQLSAAELSLALQYIEMKRRLLRLAVLRGSIWEKVTLPKSEFSSIGVSSNGN